MGVNKKLYGWYVTDKKWIPIKVSMGGSVIIDGVPDHGVDHQDGGSDEIVVTGLSGLLADCQTPCDHHEEHEDGGADEIDVTGLVGLPDAIPQYLIAYWDPSDGAIPTGWSEYAIGDYSDDLCTGGTATSLSYNGDTHKAPEAFDDDDTDYYRSDGIAEPQWLKYDFGVGVTHTVRRLRVKSVAGVSVKAMDDFIFQGSNDDVEWTNLYTGNGANNENWQDFDFANSIAYRYVRIYCTTLHAAGDWGIYEAEVKSVGVTQIQKD